MIRKIVAFDLDGTLINSAPDLTTALNNVLKKNKLNEVSEKKVKSLIGKGAKALLVAAYELQNKKIISIDELVKQFLLEYRICFKKKTALFKHTYEAIEQLKINGIDLILVSNKPQYYVFELMKYFNLTNFFVSMSGGDTFSIKKPNPKHIFYTLEKGGINPNNLGIFIGDSKYDYLCAKNANWPCLLYSNGYSDVDIETIGAHKVFDDYSKLPSIIFEMFDNHNF